VAIRRTRRPRSLPADLLKPWRVLQAFLTTLAKLRAGPRAGLAPAGLSVHGVGHSNGALLHLLIGSLYAPQNASNVLISFNNK